MERNREPTTEVIKEEIDEEAEEMKIAIQLAELMAKEKVVSLHEVLDIEIAAIDKAMEGWGPESKGLQKRFKKQRNLANKQKRAEEGSGGERPGRWNFIIEEQIRGIGEY